jgi:superfamily II DNA or RNA helicase
MSYSASLCAFQPAMNIRSESPSSTSIPAAFAAVRNCFAGPPLLFDDPEASPLGSVTTSSSELVRSDRGGIQNGAIDLALDTEIEAARKDLAGLDRLRELAAARVSELERLRGSASSAGVGSNEWTAASKLRLFRDLFRGREDVFAVRWENHDRSRSGYSPRCAHEWQGGVCGKPKIRCGDCVNQAFVALDDRQVLAHLQGRHVIGIYPLLPDDRCRLLAIDLDRGSWRADVQALTRTCLSLGVHPTIERSRSGNGAHIWFFFSEPVPAAEARRLGFTILTAAMAQGVALGVDSYDRLFPSQDVLPSGGFGNLIALPLQRAARNAGNTEFLNDRLEPHRDQWSYLASVPKITPPRLAELIADGDEDQVLAVRPAMDPAVRPATDPSDPPWRPPRSLRERVTETRLPDSIEATLADRVYVDRSQLPPTLAQAIRRLATFANPMFTELQRMRLSVARTPRVIGCFEELDRYLALPRGCLADLGSLAEELNVKLNLRDERVEGEAVELEFCGELNDSQHTAAGALLQHDVGVLCAPPGWGKTVLATQLIASRGCSTLVLVHRMPLVEQWTERLREFLGIPPRSIGRLGAGRRRLTRRIDIAMIQTLARSGDPHDLVRAYGHVVIDECQHVPAVQVERVLSAVSARYVTGLTATPYRRDGHQPIISMQCGPVRHIVSGPEVCAGGALERRVIRKDTSFDPSVLPSRASIQEIYGALANDIDRLGLVLADIRELVREDRALVVLTERREHLDRIADSVREEIPNLVVLHGGIKPKARRAAMTQLAEQPDDEPRLILATGRYLGEGFDDPRLDTLLLTLPIAWKGTVVQYAGRLHRAHSAKRDIRIYDYVDAEVPVLRRMYAKRLRTYREMGYVCDEPAQELSLAID